MLGSTIINQRQHVGLQKLSALAGITHSSLGPNEKYKFIQDDTSGESAIVCSCFRICQNLELTCAVGQLVYETIQAHNNVYHTGSGGLLFLAGAWSRAALECLHRGIPVPHIISAMSEGIDMCLDVCSKSSILLEGFGVAQSETCPVSSYSSGLQLKPITEASQALSQLQRKTESHQKNLTASGRRKMKLSRHFCQAFVKSEDVTTLSQPSQPKCLDIGHIAERLSHGSADLMNLAVKASYVQSENNEQDNGCFTFDVTKVVTCVLPGLPEEQACVLSGCVILLSAEQASVAQNLKEQRLNVALMTGDLSDSYHHLGFSRPAGIQCVTDQAALGSSHEEEWMVTVVTLLLNLEVNVILVSGLVDEKVIQSCCRHHILVVEKVKASVLKTFAKATGAVPVTYATQLTKQCVGTGVTVVIWRDLSNHERKSFTAVNISTHGHSGLVTVILTSCVEGKLQAREDQFWSCAYRLHHAFKDGAVLPGAGAIEMLCIHQLQKQAEHLASHCTKRNASAVQRNRTEIANNHYRGAVLHLMADGLIDYVSTAMVNTGRFSKVKARTVVSQQLQDCSGLPAKFSQLVLEGENEDMFLSFMKSSEAPGVCIYDNLSVKQEAWRKALDLVFLVLQTDAEVVTGIDKEADNAQRNLMLL